MSDEMTLPAMLAKFEHEVQRALPAHLDAGRICQIALNQFNASPAVAKSCPASVFAAIMQASQLGLEIGTLGQAFLVPYAGKCNLIPGWRGFISLAQRQKTHNIWTGAIYDGDDFNISFGDSPSLKVKPGLNHGNGNITHVYAIAKSNIFADPIIEIWTMEKVIQHRDKYNKQGSRHYSYKHLEMYARKMPLLQVLKYVPMSPEMTVAIQLDNASVNGSQNITIDNAIDGTWEDTTAYSEDTHDVKGQEISKEEKTDQRNLITDDHFNSKKCVWKNIVASGRKTPEELITFLSSKNMFSGDQIKEMTSWK